MPYYLSQVIREYNVRDYDSDGHLRTGKRTEVMASNERFAPFAVEDDSGWSVSAARVLSSTV